MIQVDDLSIRFGKRVLFEKVNLKFRPDHCYGIIGANGAGKSTFLKALSGELDPSTGHISIPNSARMSVLKQDHFEYNDVPVLSTVIMGHGRLHNLMAEKDAIYAKPDFSEEDGIRAGELEAEFADLNGWDAESDAATLLSGLGISESKHSLTVKELTDEEKVRVLLAQALFGNPEVLLLDEPTNHLDIDSILWLENFLLNFKNTVIVVSHDRHFLDKVCTHIVDIDFKKATMFTGNYSFWYHTSQLVLKQSREQNKRKEEKVAELKAFIQRFSANAAKSKQATSRKKLLEKINLDDIKPSTRRYPHIAFKFEKDVGKELLHVEGLTKTVGDQVLFKDVTFSVRKGDRIAFVGADSLAITAFFDCLMGLDTPDSGEIRWGQTVNKAYFPRDNTSFFEDCDYTLIDWLRQFSEDKEENFIRSFLGRMLFTGEESLKKAKVLSGGEKVRCMLSRMMLQDPNTVILDGPTNHLDLESITALNNGLMDYKGTVLLQSHDVQFAASLATRIIEIDPTHFDDREMPYEDYLQKRAKRINA